jgi:hypothetical protein
MTSEVCLMNSLSVVLAADSATTVQYYGEDGPETRYFKGANKIFQLSNHFPAGLMIYNNANLLGVPWEVSIKEFRKILGNKSFNTVEGFSDEFISWVNLNTQFFPEEERKKDFIGASASVILDDFLQISKEYKNDQGLDLSARLKEINLEKDVSVDLEVAGPEEVSILTPMYVPDLFENLKRYNGLLPVQISEDTLLELCPIYVRRTIIQQNSSESYTGLVFAGFGDHSVFPELVSYDRCQIVGRKFLAKNKSVEKISSEKPALISGFAQTSMVDTFDVGISFEVFLKISEIFGSNIKTLIDDAASKFSALDKAELNNALSAQLKKARGEIFAFTRKEHSTPLRRVLGSLPVDEMAELAETLINLQSLKEKVTKPSETVGGPVDVAAITRGEGLVWIKRKHFFPAEINSRYFDRKVSQRGES